MVHHALHGVVCTGVKDKNEFKTLHTFFTGNSVVALLGCFNLLRITRMINNKNYKLTAVVMIEDRRDDGQPKLDRTRMTTKIVVIFNLEKDLRTSHQKEIHFRFEISNI